MTVKDEADSPIEKAAALTVPQRVCGKNVLEVGFDVTVGGEIASLDQRDEGVVTELYKSRRPGAHLLNDRRSSFDERFGWYAIPVTSRAAHVEPGRLEVFPGDLRKRWANVPFRCFHDFILQFENFDFQLQTHSSNINNF